eukprot:4761931-Amphidinium_carterae.1
MNTARACPRRLQQRCAFHGVKFVGTMLVALDMVVAPFVRRSSLRSHQFTHELAPFVQFYSKSRPAPISVQWQLCLGGWDKDRDDLKATCQRLAQAWPAGRSVAVRPFSAGQMEKLLQKKSLAQSSAQGQLENTRSHCASQGKLSVEQAHINISC